MLIRVKYHDGKFDLVREFRLDHLIVTKAIHSFERSSGWVVLGVDPIRRPGTRSAGRVPERRTPPLSYQANA
jgi:hypothetical protein